MAGTEPATGNYYDFEQFGLRQVILSSRSLRQLGGSCRSMEAAAQEVVDFFYESFRLTSTAEPACALVRCFKTHRFSDLPPNLRETASSALPGGRPDEAMMCLTLLATRGALPEWNTRHGSCGHKVIPLATEAMIERAPMIAQMVQEVGLQPGDLLDANPASVLSERDRRTFDIFHVEHALGSRYVPAQRNFVEAFGVRSVLGFAGQLPNGELFFVLLFTRAPVTQETAGMFRTLALGVKLAFLGHEYGCVFED